MSKTHSLIGKDKLGSTQPLALGDVSGLNLKAKRVAKASVWMLFWFASGRKADEFRFAAALLHNNIAQWMRAKLVAVVIVVVVQLHDSLSHYRHTHTNTLQAMHFACYFER